MLQALYDFQAPYEHTLSFSDKDLFIVLKKNNTDDNWVHVVNLNGVSGYAPVNYVTAASCSVTEEIEHIDRVVNRITSRKQPAGSKDYTTVIENLLETRASLEKQLQDLATEQIYQLSCIVRRNTKCNFQDAQAASFEALKYLQRNILPNGSNGLERLLKTNLSHVMIATVHFCLFPNNHFLYHPNSIRLTPELIEIWENQDSRISQILNQIVDFMKLKLFENHLPTMEPNRS